MEVSMVSLFIWTYLNRAAQQLVLSELKTQRPNVFGVISEQIRILNSNKKNQPIVPADRVWKTFTKVLNAQ